MKIMVTGIGGVGGYLASVLCANYTGVTLIARKKRKESLQKNGLILHSDYFGEHAAYPHITDDPASTGIQDIIFVCVKNYSLEAAVSAILPCIADHTIIVLVLNGVDHAAAARKLIKTGHIVDSTMYINAAYNSDYSIRQMGKFARIFIGSDNVSCNEKVYTLLDHPGLKCRIAEDIQVELWNKYITNCAYNVITAYYESTIGEVFKNPQRLAEFRILIEEAYAVGKGVGVNLDADLTDTIFQRVAEQKNKDTTSSLARDIIARRQSELDTFSGYLLRTANELNIPVPLSEKFYHEINQRIKEIQ